MYFHMEEIFVLPAFYFNFRIEPVNTLPTVNHCFEPVSEHLWEMKAITFA